MRLLRAGEADVVVCGCSEAPLFPTLADTFGNARALARGWADPTEASRPFDRRRNGLVLGEGAGVFVLERAEHADARGARRYADVLGWGATNDAHHPTTPAPGRRRAPPSACAGRWPTPGIEPGRHRLRQRPRHQHQARRRRRVAGHPRRLRRRHPAGQLHQGVTGHMLGASGVVEAAVCVEALRRGLLPPTHNLDDPDPACDLDHIRKSAARRAGRRT